MLEGLASRLFSSKKPEASEFTKALMVLAAIDKKMWARAILYVQSGDEASLLSEWAQSDDDLPRRYLGFPGQVGYRYSAKEHEDNKVIDAVSKGWTIDKSLTARGALYARAAAIPDERFVRFGRLLAALDGPGAIDQTSPLTPAWLAYLVLDIFEAKGVRKTEDLTARLAPWTPQRLERMLVAEGSTALEARRIVLATVFDRSGMSSNYSGMPVPNLLTMQGLVGYVATDPQSLSDLVPSFALEGRRAFLTFVSTNTLLDAFVATVARLTTDSSKVVRGEAFALLTHLDEAAQASTLEPILASAAAGRVAELITVLARSEPGRALLARTLETEKPGKRADLIREAITRDSVIVENEVTVEVPPFTPVVDAPLPADFVARARAVVDRSKASTREWLTKEKESEFDKWTKQRIARNTAHLASLEAISDRDIAAYGAFLGGTAPKPKNIESLSTLVEQAGFYDLGIFAALRMHVVPTTNYIAWWRIVNYGVRELDLRAIHEALTRTGYPQPDYAIAQLVIQMSAFEIEDPNKIWPFFHERPELIEQVLGIRPFPPGTGVNQRGYADEWNFSRILDVLATMPVVPGSVLTRLGEVALGSAKTNRVEAQQLLAKQVDAVALAGQGLTNSKFEIRTTAAQWLGRIRDVAAIPALQTALAKEKREGAKAAILSSLEQLGVDISEYLSPAVLTAEAKKGGARPAAIAWFPFEGLPAAKWASGAEVPREVLEWWITLATKLNDPAGAGLLGRYTDQLDEASQAAVGEYVARAWIAEDTRNPPDAESRAYAAATGPQRYTYFQDLAKKHPEYYGEYADRTLDDMIEEMRREHASQYVGSAIASKGILALTFGIPGHRFVALAQAFMRDHYRRRAQVEALITAASYNDDPMVMQLLLGVARRHRTASVQTKARELVESLAERKGWTTDQLADRTVPTAGFDDDGILPLSYGEREFTGRLTPAFGLELTSPTGSVLKSLPAKRELEDAELVKEAKAQLTASRSELKQLVAMQTQRLYEAMCITREWPAAEWTEFLRGQPIVSRLIAGLVWVENPGDAQRLFRLADGALIDANDDDVTLAEGATVALAHTALVSPEQAASWTQHLTDYGVTPLFEQFGGATPTITAETTEISDHQGWVSDAFTIRGLATKRNYLRGSSEDGGWFTEYTKDFTSAGVRLVLGFTGNSLPEENIRAAITTLSARPLVRGRAGGRDIQLSTLPPVLLAEAYGDYVRIAEAGAFETDWEKNTAW